MSKFFSSYNNGVTALVSEEHDKLFATLLNGAKATAGINNVDYQKLYQTAQEAGVKVFTFCPKEYIEHYPDNKFIYIGTYEDLELLVKQGGHEVISHGATGWTGYVPFSNHIESGGGESAKRELMYRTTLRDVIDAFGIDAVMAKDA